MTDHNPKNPMTTDEDRTYTVREVFAMGAFRFAMGAIVVLGFVFVLTVLKGA